MASRIPSFDEYYELVDNYLDSDDFTVTVNDETREQLITSLIVIIEDFYNSHQYITIDEVLNGSFEDDLEELKTTLKEEANILLNEYISSIQFDQNSKYDIPEGIVETDDRFGDVISSSIDAVTNQLKEDVSTKAHYYSIFMMPQTSTSITFNMNSNFKRFVDRFKDGIDFNFQAVKGTIERNYLSFVYGENALFYWVPSGRNTCAWCYMIADMGAMPLSAFPKDHPNGACQLIPANPNKYSDIYQAIRGEL